MLLIMIPILGVIGAAGKDQEHDQDQEQELN